jgi:hypothetical protein
MTPLPAEPFVRRALAIVEASYGLDTSTITGQLALPAPRDQNDPGAQLRKLFRRNLASRGAADSNAGLPKGGRKHLPGASKLTWPR